MKKLAFYHFNSNKNSTHFRLENQSVKDIQSEMRGNEATLDAIVYYNDNEEVTCTIYNRRKNYCKYDYIENANDILKDITLNN